MDAEIVRWFEFPRPSRAEDVQKAITAWRENWRTGGPVRQSGIWHEGHLAGGVEVQDRGDRIANISHVVFSQYRRRGLASDAVGLAATWALGHIPVDSVVAVIDVEHGPSVTVLERFGFVPEGLAERWEYDESGPSVRYVSPPL